MKKLVIHHKPGINFNILIAITLIIFALLPSIINSEMVIQSFFQSELEVKKIEIKNQGLILADKLSRSGYIAGTNVDNTIDANIDAFSDILNGRIIIVDKSFSIIRDTFNLATGKKNISDEVIKCFNGEGTLKIHNKKGYLVYAIPVNSYIDSGNIDGVLMITVSTENINSILNNAKDKNLMFLIMMGFIVILIAVVVTKILNAPIYKLKEETQTIVDGSLSYNVAVNNYSITREISNNINSALSQLRTMNKSRDEFVANVSHELKTPITSIRVLADSILSMEDAPTELYKEFMNDISEEVDRESKIIEDLLTLVRLDKSNADINVSEVDINKLLETTLKRLRPIASKRSIEIILETIRGVVAQVDETKLDLAISNLVENAIKYNVDEGYVKVILDADHKFFYITVEDSGIGIPENSIKNIFDRFYRVDKARAREAGGTGLGLAITRNIILKHNGTVRVTSSEGRGSTFFVRLPLNYVKRE